MENQRKRGNKGEDVAVYYLTKKGYDVIARNYLKREGEIDIVAQKKSVLVFVEVKSSFAKERKNIQEKPEARISKSKIEKIKKAALSFIEEKGYSPEQECRCDVVSIIFIGRNIKVKHIKWAF